MVLAQSDLPHTCITASFCARVVMNSRFALALVLASACYTSSTAQPRSAPAPAPAQAPAPAASATVAVSANTTGSLGSLCSSQVGLLTALSGVAANSNSAGLNVTIPATLNTPATLQEVAQVRLPFPNVGPRTLVVLLDAH